MNEEINKILEERSRAIGQLAYLHARYPAERAARLQSRQSLYFVTCGDAVKIGVSVDPTVRLETLQTGAPGKLKLLAIIPGAGHREYECHKALEHLHLHGEWFRRTSEVDQLIERLRHE